jgi:hypothetical protein
MQKHVRILGWCYIVMAILDILFGLLLFGLMSGLGFMAAGAGDLHAMIPMSMMGGMIGTIMLVLAIPNLVVGLGFLRGWGGWVIVVACIVSLFNLAKPPIGTALAIYTFWVAYKLYQAQEPESPQS